MIFHIQAIQDICSKIGVAVDNADTTSAINDALELSVGKGFLYANTTNNEYYVSCKAPIDTVETFHATVSASMFLKLISMTTTETIEMSVEDNALVVKGNGVYNIPLIFKGSEMLTLPKITLENKEKTFKIPTKILTSLILYNSKEFKKGKAVRASQNMYYLDKDGAITYIAGACLNMFDLPIDDTKIMLSRKFVNLFKILDSDEVSVIIGKDQRTDGEYQNKMVVISDKVAIYANLNSDPNVVESVPVRGIRNRASKMYPYSTEINKDKLIQTINRFLIFAAGKLASCKFTFESDRVTISNHEGKSHEIVALENSEGLISGESYVATLDLNDLKTTLESCYDDTFTLKFGDSQAIMIKRATDNVVNIIPEISVV